MDCWPCEPTETSSVFPVFISCTNTSGAPFVSPATRLEAQLVKHTYRPSAVIDEYALSPFPWAPLEATETRVVLPVTRSWTNTSACLFVSPVTRFGAQLVNDTKRPFALIEGL